MRSRITVALTVFVVAASAAAGCGSERAGDGTASPDELGKFYDQKIAWKKCKADDYPEGVQAKGDASFECGTVEVPIDYRKPDGSTVEIALNRIPATDKEKRVGSLVTNPGGPGGSGLALAFQAPELFTPDLLARYDVIGMDPRGVGQSHPVRCQTESEQARTEAADDDVVAQRKAYVAACARETGPIMNFVGTDNVARDLDILRGALGEDKLNYLGFSYGTVLGQFYADQFPKNTGRMVLDSVANPSVWPGDPSAQAIGFETALKVFVEGCTQRRDCPMGRDRATVTKQIDDLTAKLAKDPLPIGADSPPLTDGALLGALSSAMYKEQTWPDLEKALAAAFKGDGKPMGTFLQKIQSGGSSLPIGPAAAPAPGPASAPAPAPVPAPASSSSFADEDRLSGSFEAISCLHVRPEQRKLKVAINDAEEAQKDAPIFGITVGAQRLTCGVWPVKSLRNAGRAIAAKGAPTILLVHNLYDAATPVQWARGVDGQLDKAVLVTNTSGGHGFYPKGPCTKRTVDTFLLTGKLPAKGTICHDRSVAEK